MRQGKVAERSVSQRVCLHAASQHVCVNRAGAERKEQQVIVGRMAGNGAFVQPLLVEIDHASSHVDPVTSPPALFSV